MGAPRGRAPPLRPGAGSRCRGRPGGPRPAGRCLLPVLLAVRSGREVSPVPSGRFLGPHPATGWSPCPGPAEQRGRGDAFPRPVRVTGGAGESQRGRVLQASGMKWQEAASQAFWGLCEEQVLGTVSVYVGCFSLAGLCPGAGRSERATRQSALWSCAGALLLLSLL